MIRSTTDTAGRMAAIMVERLGAGLATEAATLRRLGFSQADIDSHGPAAIARARHHARRLKLLEGSRPDGVDLDPLAA